MKGNHYSADLPFNTFLMKKHLFLLIISLIIISCGTSKKILPETPKTSSIEEIDPSRETPKTPAIAIEVEKEPEIKAINFKTKDEDTKTNSEIDTLHESFNSLLQKYVTPDGKVNYLGFAKEKSVLRGYISSLSTQLPDTTWTKERKLAYWMNAYNAMTVDLILRNQPLKSIKDIKNPWNQRLWKLGAKWYHLNEIEHSILRKMEEPRIHFGINCASFSCPPLSNKAFTSENVEQQLEALAIQFINDEKRNSISPDYIEISKIFDWFGKDFKTKGSIVDYLNTYSKTPINTNAKVRYKDYDWNLNN